MDFLNNKYYSNVDEKTKKIILDKIGDSLRNLKSDFYLLDKIPNDINNDYKTGSFIFLFIKNYKLCIININMELEDLIEFESDFLNDIYNLSKKYQHNDLIGRPREWKESLVCTFKNIDEFNLNQLNLDKSEEKRKIDIILSLVTGSINDISKISKKIDTPLSTIKNKVAVFDAMQSEFIYSDNNKKVIKIQGLAGTGKTELLLHKLRQIIMNDNNCKIAFTCHNRVLAKDLKRRIPDFFDRLKVDVQIKWNEKLFVFHAWGSMYEHNMGLYSYICKEYSQRYYTLSDSNDFNKNCKELLESIKEINNFEYLFDYIFVDESQDFGDDFIKLCEYVTNKKVIVAGDLFQNIFDNNISSEQQVDFLLNKCYRTEPKTLMFAHGISMGLFEEKKISWLEKDEFCKIGYNVNEEPSNYILTREPIYRFSEEDSFIANPIDLIELGSDGEQYVSKVLEIIKTIRQSHPDVESEDIAILSTYKQAKDLTLLKQIQYGIENEFDGWKCNMAFETKERLPDHLFISNSNNVKGLEFPFVICLVPHDFISDIRVRNSIYMILTRSYLNSYLIIDGEKNKQICSELRNGLVQINQHRNMIVSIPTNEEKNQIRTTLREFKYKNPTLQELVDEYYSDLTEKLKTQKKDKEDFKQIIDMLIEKNVINTNNYEKKIKEITGYE